MADEEYFIIPGDYLFSEFLPFWKSYKQKVGLTYRKGRTDCDDFALVFKAQIAIAALTVNTTAAPSVGTAQVTNHAVTLGVQAGNHVLNIIAVLLEKQISWIMLDPITDQYENLASYPASIRRLSI